MIGPTSLEELRLDTSRLPKGPKSNSYTAGVVRLSTTVPNILGTDSILKSKDHTRPSY